MTSRPAEFQSKVEPSAPAWEVIDRAERTVCSDDEELKDVLLDLVKSNEVLAMRVTHTDKGGQIRLY